MISVKVPTWFERPVHPIVVWPICGQGEVDERRVEDEPRERRAL